MRPDGSIRWVHDRSFPVRDEHGAVVRFAGITEDVTEARQAEDALRQANRQLQILSRRRINVQEEERRILARALHDQIGQLLTVGKINLQSARQLKDRKAINKKLDETIGIVEQVLQQARQISFALRPPVLDDLGLAPALRWMLGERAGQAGLLAEFTAGPDLKRADLESETACYRVALEAVANVLRHAQATKIWLELHNGEDALHLIVRNDGSGFDVAKAEQRARRDRLGLIGMRERAMAVGGQFEIKSDKRGGTEVRAVFPLSPKPDAPSEIW